MLQKEDGYVSAKVALDELNKYDALSKFTKGKKLKNKSELPKISHQSEEINKAIEENNQ